jgi:hypothetical protein
VLRALFVVLLARGTARFDVVWLAREPRASTGGGTAMRPSQDMKDTLQKDLELLGKARDELKLQMHLAKADAKSEWAKLEATWTRINEQLQLTRNGTEQPLKDLTSAAKTLLEELRGGYARVREQLKQPEN